MQLGTRWSVGSPPPATLPEPLRAAIQSVEADLAREGVDAQSWRWTLTWLERRPIVELDDGTSIRYDESSGTTQIVQPGSAV